MVICMVRLFCMVMFGFVHCGFVWKLVAPAGIFSSEG